MRIQMIGHSRAGKTTFMAAMYRVMKKEAGYRLCLRHEYEREQLDRLGINLSKGIYPAETDAKSLYMFDFHYKSEKLFSFEWMDYRGGILDGGVDDLSALRVIDRCAERCESMIVFVDGTTLDSKEGLKQWSHLVNFILKFSGRANEDNPLSLTIIVTKMDICAWKGDFTETLVGAKIMKVIQQINSNRNLHGMIAFSEINRNTYGNTYYSVLHAMCIPLIKCIHKEYEKLQQDIKKFESRHPSIWNDISSWWNDRRSERQKAERDYNSMLRRQETLQTLLQHIEKIEKILERSSSTENFIQF